MNTKQIGNLTELQCITRFYELGYTISIPYGDSDKYDMILDKEGKLYRMQAKHCQAFYEDDKLSYIKIRTTWKSGYTKNVGAKRHKYSKEDTDFFVTNFNSINQIIPVEESSNEKTLRVLLPKNGQTKGVCMMNDYKDIEVLKNL